LKWGIKGGEDGGANDKSESGRWGFCMTTNCVGGRGRRGRTKSTGPEREGEWGMCLLTFYIFRVQKIKKYLAQKHTTGGGSPRKGANSERGKKGYR